MPFLSVPSEGWSGFSFLSQLRHVLQLATFRSAQPLYPFARADALSLFLSVSVSTMSRWVAEGATVLIGSATIAQLLLFQRHVSASRGRRKKFFERKMIAPPFCWGLSAGISCREKSSFRYESRSWFCVIGPRIQLIGRTWTWKVRREERKERKEWKEISFFRPYESFDFINITFEWLERKVVLSYPLSR